jgi:hypothetical protein
MSRLSFTAVALLALVAWPARRAVAEVELSDAERLQHARALYKVGQSHVEQMHDYRGAIEYFEESYRYAPRPLLLFDIARVARAGNLPDKSIAYFERYLAVAEPRAPERAEATRALRELRATALEAPAPPPRPAEAAPAPALSSPPAASAAPPSAAPRAAAPPRGHKLQLLGWSLGGAGVAIGGAGIGLAVAASRTGDDVTRDAASGRFDLAKYARGRDEQLAGDVLLAVGAGAAVAGVVLALVGRREAHAAYASLAPCLLPGGGGVALVLR